MCSDTRRTTKVNWLDKQTQRKLTLETKRTVLVLETMKSSSNLRVRMARLNGYHQRSHYKRLKQSSRKNVAKIQVQATINQSWPKVYLSTPLNLQVSSFLGSDGLPAHPTPRLVSSQRIILRCAKLLIRSLLLKWEQLKAFRTLLNQTQTQMLYRDQATTRRQALLRLRTNQSAYSTSAQRLNDLLMLKPRRSKIRLLGPAITMLKWARLSQSNNGTKTSKQRVQPVLPSYPKNSVSMGNKLCPNKPLALASMKSPT